MEEFKFVYKIDLNDLDYMNIVGHANWLVLFQKARTDWCEKIGYPFAHILRDQIGVVIAELKIKYLRSAYFEDLITISVVPHSPFNTGVFFKCKAKNQNNKFCVIADFKLVFINTMGKPIAMPEKFAEVIGYNRMENAI